MSELEQKEPKRQSQVTEQTNNLGNSLSVLHDRIGKLTDRFSSVLRLPDPLKEEENKDRVELVVLANTVQDFDDSAMSAICKLEDILERLEI